MRVLALVSLICLSITSVYAQDDVIDEGRYNQHQALVDQGWMHLTGSDFEVAVEKFNQAIEIYDGNADAYLGRANALMKFGKLDEAEQDVQKALGMTGEQADMYYLAGNIYFKMEDYFKATDYYSKALDFNELSEVPIDSMHCYYNRGNAYYEAGMYRSAISDFSKAIEIQSDFKNAYHNRGLAYSHRGSMTEACMDFFKAKELGDLSSDKYIKKYCSDE